MSDGSEAITTIEGVYAMLKQLIVPLLALACCLLPSARAANIIWVSDSYDELVDGIPDDAGFFELLETTGHMIDNTPGAAFGDGYWRTLDADKIAALKAIVNSSREQGDVLLKDFYDVWKDDPLVVDKWLTIQAVCSLPGTIERVQELTLHPAFVLKNPNKVRALIGAFSQANQVHFHDRSGVGYSFLVEFVLRLDALNPQIAARLLTPLTTWKRYDAVRQAMMRNHLERIMAVKELSGDVAEVASKSLK